MFDALSDVADWLTAIPWDAVGIGAAIVAAVAASLHFGQVMLIAWIKKGKRKKLGEFLREGEELHRQCNDEAKELPVEEADDWDDRTEAYLEKHLGSDYAVRFSNDSGLALPQYTASWWSDERRGLESGIRIRLARLQQFLGELG